MVGFDGGVASPKAGPLGDPKAGDRPFFGCFAEINEGPLGHHADAPWRIPGHGEQHGPVIMPIPGPPLPATL
jgi:hypothetical protein